MVSFRFETVQHAYRRDNRTPVCSQPRASCPGEGQLRLHKR
jgi:hypothetical protein